MNGAPGLIIPKAPAICDMSAIWFIIISCNINGFVMLAIAFMSMGGMPFIGKPAFIIIAAMSGEGALVMLSIRA